MEKETMICEVCGQAKTSEEMSKSYKQRCKSCVAEMTRNNRQNKVHAVTKNDHRTDLAAVEVRLVEAAISSLVKKTEGRIMKYDCNEIGTNAVEIAHAAMSRMKFIKSTKDEQSINQ